MAFMVHSDDSHEIVRPGEGRDQWLAMQSAYAEHRRASDALAAADDSAEDLLTRRSLENQQRLAFEQYLEARLAFLEFRFDASNGSRGSPDEPPTREMEYSAIRSWFGRYRSLFLAVAVALVCTAAVTLIRAQKRVRDLEAARDQLRLELSTARDEIQRVAKRMDAASSAQPPATAETAQVRSSPAKPAAKPQPVRRSYRFSLAPSHKFKRIGPIEVALRSVDARQNRISLSILSDSSKLNLQHVRPNSPIRIDGADRGQHMELVIDRIAADGVYGHLIETRS
jgi:hypothetical protein